MIRPADSLFLSFTFFAATVALMPAPVLAQGKPPHTPKVVFDGDGSHLTPLAKGLSNTAQSLRNKARSQGKACQDPTGSDTPADRRNKAAACNVADVAVVNAPDTNNGCSDCGASDVTDSNGRTIGKKLKNQVTVSYDNPSERVDNNGNPLSSWPPLTLGGKRQVGSANNEDDSGPIVDSVPDPGSLSQKSADASGLGPTKPSVTQFHNNLTNVPLTGSDCSTFGSGTQVQSSDGTKITLPQASNGQGLGTLNTDGTCDVSRAFIVAANMLAGASSHSKAHSMAFDADSNGFCNTDPTKRNPNAAVACGQERRKHTISEEYTAHCPGNSEYVDGVCVKKTGPQAAFGQLSLASLLSPSDPLTTTSSSNAAMMGFTLAPPEVSWGYSIDESMCVDLVFTDFCITLFSARIGYDFDVAAGLRLPVQLDTSGIPDSVLAGSTATLTTSLTAQDFSAQQYKDFCTNNDIADGVLVASCDRFSFPEFFSSLLNSVDSSVPVDGKEVVAQSVIFAGVQVVVMDVTVIDVGIDAGSDYATDCTFLKLKDEILSTIGTTAGQTLLQNLSDFGTSNMPTDVALQFLNTLKDKGLNCSSFTTPFGADSSGNQLTFPFSKSFHVDADCTKAKLQGSTVKVKGEDKPICTGLALEYAGATLGIGLDIQFGLGSSDIKAEWSASGDGRTSSSTDPGTTVDLDFHQLSGTIENPSIGPIVLDNFDTSTDTATVQVNNFDYLLNTFTVELDANIEFGGILSPIPNLPSFEIFQLAFSTGDIALPIPQHHGMRPISLPSIFVRNYALSLSDTPVPTTKNPLLPAAQNNLDPTRPALGIKPGSASGVFNMQIRNEGSVTGTFDNFQTIMPDQNPQFSFLAPGWTGVFGASSVANVGAHSNAPQTVSVTITPVKDPSTRPQVYPITLEADSNEARTLNMASEDPSHFKRLAASDVIYVNVLPYFDPRITSTPAQSNGKPGAASQGYSELIQNHGNAPDNILLTSAAIDFNQGKCTLTTLGGAACPYRAVPTSIPATWTTAAGLTPEFDGLAVLGTGQTGFSIGVPPDWAGMTNTTYTFAITVTSGVDDGVPPASSAVNIKQIVVATKQSMTRYIGLELADLALQIQKANAAGVSTGGALPIITRDVQPANARALASILAGNLGGASNTLNAEIKSMGGFLKAINGPSLPPDLLADWTARANAIIADLTTAQASTITSN